MLVEADEYELPLIVAESAQELAMKCGVHVNAVYSAEWKNCNGAQKGVKYVKVRKEDD